MLPSNPRWPSAPAVGIPPKAAANKGAMAWRTPLRFAVKGAGLHCSAKRCERKGTNGLVVDVDLSMCLGWLLVGC